MNTTDCSSGTPTPNPYPRRVVCAALLGQDGALIVGARHYDFLMRRQIVLHPKGTFRSAEQGFIDQWGVFMTREEALKVALSQNQRIYRCGGDEQRLFSENLY